MQNAEITCKSFREMPRQNIYQKNMYCQTNVAMPDSK